MSVDIEQHNLDMLKQAVDINTLDSDIIEKMSFPKPIPKEEWYEEVEGFFATDDGFIEVETSKEDMNRIEELLGVKKDFFSVPYVVKTKQEHCPNCNRRNNFLDVVATGLRLHSPKFLLDVFTGKYGHVMNTNSHQRCLCYECGEVLPKDATKFSAPKKPTTLPNGGDPPPAYLFPVYTYRF